MENSKSDPDRAELKQAELTPELLDDLAMFYQGRAELLPAQMATQAARDARRVLALLAEIEEAERKLAACAPFLKDDETPVECIERNRGDIDVLLTMLAQRTKERDEARANA